MNKILVNKIQCKHCGDIIESESVHDFKMCSCGKVGVDGGKDYIRRLGYPEDIIELSVMEDTKKKYEIAIWYKSGETRTEEFEFDEIDYLEGRLGYLIMRREEAEDVDKIEISVIEVSLDEDGEECGNESYEVLKTIKIMNGEI